MEPLILKEHGEFPAIDFNGSTGVFLLSGKSYPENVNEFYKPVFDYLEQYKKAPQEKTTMVFNWLYYNTATSKIIIKLIMALKELKVLNKKVEILWRCKKSDELMIEKGEEIKEILDIDFNIIYV
jgi:hypothetical protein